MYLEFRRSQFKILCVCSIILNRYYFLLLFLLLLCLSLEQRGTREQTAKEEEEATELQVERTKEQREHSQERQPSMEPTRIARWYKVTISSKRRYQKTFTIKFVFHKYNFT